MGNAVSKLSRAQLYVRGVFTQDGQTTTSFPRATYETIKISFDTNRSWKLPDADDFIKSGRELNFDFSELMIIKICSKIDCK